MTKNKSVKRKEKKLPVIATSAFTAHFKKGTLKLCYCNNVKK